MEGGRRGMVGGEIVEMKGCTGHSNGLSHYH